MRSSIRSSYTAFSNSSAPILKVMQRVQGEAHLALRDKSIRDQHHTIQHGSVVLLSGFIESFLRSVCENYFSELLSKGLGIKDLGDEYLKIHLRDGASHLAELIKRESKHNPLLSDSSTFIRRLVAPIIDTTRAPAWEAFARTQGNPSADVVKSVLTKLGVKRGFDGLEDAIDNKYSAATMIRMLNDLVAIRNESAHTGTTSNVPVPSHIIDLVQFTRHLALAVCRVVDKKVTELTVIA